MADIWPPQQRGIAIVGYAITIVGGPTLGPIIGGALTSSYLGWRWTEYLTGIIMMTQVVLDAFLLDESYAPVLLAYKARRLRLEGKNWALHAKVKYALLYKMVRIIFLIHCSKRNGTFHCRICRRNISSVLSSCWERQYVCS